MKERNKERREKRERRERIGIKIDFNSKFFRTYVRCGVAIY
jgi:hypothetical protein